MRGRILTYQKKKVGVRLGLGKGAGVRCCCAEDGVIRGVAEFWGGLSAVILAILWCDIKSVFSGLNGGIYILLPDQLIADNVTVNNGQICSTAAVVPL